MHTSNPAGSNMRDRRRRPRSRGSSTTDGGRSNKRQDTKHGVREGAWPVHPLANAEADPSDLEQLALILGLSGVQIEEVRELGLWMHLKENNSSVPEVRDDARGILDANLEAANMYRHLSFYRRFLVESAFHNLQAMLREIATIRALASQEQQEPTPQQPQHRTPRKCRHAFGYLRTLP